MTLKEMQETWEKGGKFVAEFKHAGAIYRIIKFHPQVPQQESTYNLQRYFEVGADRWEISVDYNDLDAETMMFALGELVQYGKVGAR